MGKDFVSRSGIADFKEAGEFLSEREFPFH
jgi:hypothetical protein